MKIKKVLVLGAGVSGLTTALKLLQAGHVVTIWSREAVGQFAPTSMSAYAVWSPCRMDNDSRVEDWCFATLDEFARLSLLPESGVRMLPLTDLQTTENVPWYAERALNRLPYYDQGGPNQFGEDKVAQDNSLLPPPYSAAHHLKQVAVIDPCTYLPWLARQITSLAGSFAQKEVECLTDCPLEYEAIVNCTGLGARQLCQDQTLQPLPMQIVQIEPNSTLTRVVFDQSGPNAQAHVVPHLNRVTLGATLGALGSESLPEDAANSAGILARTANILPGFSAGPEHITRTISCLRPKRPTPRVELELIEGRTIVHNYGHDGKGYIVSWAVAAAIVEMLSKN